MSSICLNSSPDECLAGYGFTVSADGRYVIGPSSGGQSLTGNLAPEDFAPINNILTADLSDLRNEPNHSPLCGPIHNETSREKFVLSYYGKKRDLMSAADSRLCTTAITPEEAKELYDELHRLTQRYYHLPFPDGSCETAVAALDASYASLQHCRIDADCTYVDESYQAVGDDVLEFLITGDCSAVKPLVVANRDSLAAQQETLIGERDYARDACKSRRTTPGCSGFSRFQATQPHPVCTNGVCRPGASIGAL